MELLFKEGLKKSKAPEFRSLGSLNFIKTHQPTKQDFKLETQLFSSDGLIIAIIKISQLLRK